MMTISPSGQKQTIAVNTTCKDRTTEPFTSVIVPVYNDIKSLQICLAALEQQTYRPDRYEVVVVDNGSDPGYQIEQIVAQYRHAVLTKELAPGSYAARNKGISVAKGELLAFTDADCIPATTWLASGINYLVQNPDCGMVAGKIEMFFDDPQNVSVPELYDHIVMGFPQEEFIKQSKGGMTANVFTRKSVIDTVGNFCAQLKSQGDLEWGVRVFDAGFEQVYADDVCVKHPTRKTFSSLRRRTRRLAGGIYDRYIVQEPSAWKRNKRFVKLLADDLLLCVAGSAKKVLGDQRLGNMTTRLRVLGVVYMMNAISAYEKIRLKLGGKTERG